MRRSVRLAALLVATLTSGAVLAAGSTPPGYAPDPALQTASPAALQQLVQRGCRATQARLQSTTETAVSGPCNCYASRTMRALDAAEIQAFRTTGFFNDTARAKAIAALDSCRLQRPA